jgi:hypothetical protein
MSEPSHEVTLTPAEWKLIQEIRNLPESSTRSRVHEILSEFLFYVRNPRCQGMMPEGFPCGDPRASCDQCHQIWDLLDEIEARAAHI